MNNCTAIFSYAISLWLFSFLTLFIMYHEYWNIKKLEMYKPSLSRNNSGKKVTKKLKDVFYQESPSSSRFKKDVDKPLLLYFPQTRVMLFLVRPSLYGSSVFSPYLSCTNNIGTLQNLRGTILPFQQWQNSKKEAERCILSRISFI